MKIKTLAGQAPEESVKESNFGTTSFQFENEGPGSFE